jgi:hypothetical protein
VEQHSHPQAWIEAVGWFSLAIAFASALVICADIFLRGHRQKMAIMDVVYPVTALYWGPVGLWFYYRYGRRDATDSRASEDPPRWAMLSKAVSHCGAGCTLGDIAGEWLVAGLGLTVAGKALYADIPMDFVWAWTLGIIFQYFSIVPMRDIGRLKGVWAAIKADTLSILAFQVGLFAGMAIYQMVIWPHPLPKTTATYWMMMQLAMILGFFTAMPVNAWLVRKGLKEKM